MRYETLFLAVPEITADESSTIEKQIEQMIKKSKGSIISFERWGKYKLAYPIRHNSYGVYFLTRFEFEQETSHQAAIQEVQNLFAVKYPQLVMRYMTSKLNPKDSLNYSKPESLEDVPAQDVDTFIRENKMEGLLGSNNRADYTKSAALNEEPDFEDEEDTEDKE